MYTESSRGVINMARVAYGDENSSPAVKALADQIRSERDGRMLNLYSMLLNAPPVAEGC
jgi:hypothetical protein